ncbi:MAG: hypothetical protein COW65_10340 [Cytophagales bacterium CG18_big_fil_WC_8_21_14_2_50_42_9]|nr:MAG: hypothetical protein COW65_10340 [Cytophagales bacterium CG18_big_fil_WC_8_21_14_2_50_42_9]
MPIFREENGKLQKLKVIPIAKEKNLQILIEQNLWEVLEMHLLASEYATTFGGRIDTLAVDFNGAPVIIEYKLNKNDNVINQALSYLRWLKAQKVEFFEMLLIKKLGKEVAEKLKIDWQNPRVICIAENYSKFDIDTVEVIPIRLELFKYRYYENGIFSLEALNTIEQTIDKAEKTKNVATPTAIATIDQDSSKIQPQMQALFEALRSRIRQLDENIVEKINPAYFAYRLSKNFAEVTLNKQQIRILLRPVDYKDPLNKVERVPDSFKWTLNRKVTIKAETDLDYIMQLVEQSYKDVL